MKDLPEALSRVAWFLVSKHFPGVTAETLKQGWIPVPAAFLEKQVQRWAGSVEGLETISLRCCPGHFRVQVTTSKYFAKFTIRTTIANRTFAINRSERIAVFSCAESMDIHGENLLGQVVTWLAASLVLGAVRSTETAAHVFCASKGACELKWPEITVRLDEVKEVRAVIEKKLRLPTPIGQITILDVVSLGPMQVEENCVQIKLSWSEAAGRLIRAAELLRKLHG